MACVTSGPINNNNIILFFFSSIKIWVAIAYYLLYELHLYAIWLLNVLSPILIAQTQDLSIYSLTYQLQWHANDYPIYSLSYQLHWHMNWLLNIFSLISIALTCDLTTQYILSYINCTDTRFDYSIYSQNKPFLC